MLSDFHKHVLTTVAALFMMRPDNFAVWSDAASVFSSWHNRMMTKCADGKLLIHLRMT